MEASRMKTLITRVPTISRHVALETTSTWYGAGVRAKFAVLMLVPCLFMFD